MDYPVTPGTWELLIPIDRRTPILITASPFPGGGAPVEVARVVDRTPKQKHMRTACGTGRGNARLMRAAPKLLAACERYIQDHQCAQKCDGPHSDCHCLFCEMSAAITITEGD